MTTEDLDRVIHSAHGMGLRWGIEQPRYAAYSSDTVGERASFVGLFGQRFINVVVLRRDAHQCRGPLPLQVSVAATGLVKNTSTGFSFAVSQPNSRLSALAKR